jgi:NADH:ubiquinone oxidoreductase subunit 6 (subunit J)
MTTFVTILLVLAMLGTLTVLGFGVASMLRGGDPRRSNKLMQSRVIMQALALVLLAVLMLLAKRRPGGREDGAAHSYLYARR